MKLTYLFKWDSSAGGNCPAVYDTDCGTLVVQGYGLDADDSAQLRNAAPNEVGVEIPYSLAEQIADMVNARRS
jgi:hypothetical protein